MPSSNTSQTENTNPLLDHASLTIKNHKFEINLSVKQAKIVALLGLNGAGKSTFIRNLVGEINNLDFEPHYQTSGTTNKNKSICLKTNDRKFKKLMGYQADTMLSMEQLSVFEYLNLCAGFKDISAKAFKENIKQVIADWSLENIIDQPLESLSKGNMQKVAIAQTFINDPEFLFFDEPCQSLDPIEQERFNKNISELTSFSLCIFSTHNVNHALTVADDILIIHQSKIAYYYQHKSQNDYLLFSFETKEKMSNILLSHSLQFQILGNGLYKIISPEFITEFVENNLALFEFCLAEKEALMPLFRLLASNEWQPNIAKIDSLGKV